MRHRGNRCVDTTNPHLAPCPAMRFFLARQPCIGKNRDMTNKIAIALVLLVVAVFVADAYLFEGTLPVFLGKKLFEFLEWLAFWR